MDMRTFYLAVPPLLLSTSPHDPYPLDSNKTHIGMVKIHTLVVEPALLNASCAWASDLFQLRELYNSPHTGAVTTRTATLDGFMETEANTVRISCL